MIATKKVMMLYVEHESGEFEKVAVDYNVRIEQLADIMRDRNLRPRHMSLDVEVPIESDITDVEDEADGSTETPA
jgi:hypothetical protein